MFFVIQGDHAGFAEEMLAGLQQVPWRRVDVSFLGAKAKYQAHNTIQVLLNCSSSMFLQDISSFVFE